MKQKISLVTILISSLMGISLNAFAAGGEEHTVTGKLAVDLFKTLELSGATAPASRSVIDYLVTRVECKTVLIGPMQKSTCNMFDEHGNKSIETKDALALRLGRDLFKAGVKPIQTPVSATISAASIQCTKILLTNITSCLIIE